MLPNIIIRAYENGDEKDIVESLKIAFPNWGGNSPLDYWKWKFLDNPTRSIIVVAESNGRVVGALHGVLLNVKMANSTVLSVYGCDAAVHPDFRGMGVHSKLLDLSSKIQHEKKVKFAYLQSRNPIVVKKFEELSRQQFPHYISYMVRIRDLDLHLKMRPVDNPGLVKYGFTVKKKINALKTLIIPTHSIDDFSIQTVDKFDNSLDSFWEKIKTGYDFISDKSSLRLNWRYLDPRAGNFVVKRAVKDGEVLGFIVLEYRNSGDYPEGFISDLLTLPNRLDVAEALINDACLYFERLSVNSTYFLVVRDHPLQKIVEKYGYVDSGKSPNIICEPKDVSNEFSVVRTSLPRKIYFSYMDCL
jgi:hypothetical protein